MKILQINNYHYLRGGSEKVYLETGRLLNEHGHNIIYFSVNDEESFDSVSKEYFITPVDYKGSSISGKIKAFVHFFYSSEAARNLEHLLEKEQPDIAHLHIFYGRLTSSILPVLRKHNIPVVMTVHEYKILCPVYTLSDLTGNLCEMCADGNTLPCIKKRCNKGSLLYSTVSAMEVWFRDHFFSYQKYIDHFIFVSNFLQGKHLKYHPTIKECSSVVPNAINTEVYSPISSKGDYFLYFGRLSHEKGLIELLEVWLQMEDPPVLVIIGSGPLIDDLRRLAGASIGRIEVIGPRYGSELTRYIQGASFILFPSRWHETFGLTAIEAFACGKPVISSNLGALPDLVEEDKTGYLFDPFHMETLPSLIEKAQRLSQEEYYEMSLNCINKSKQYGEEEYYHRLMNVYQSILL